MCCRVKCKRKSDDFDPYFTEESIMARSTSACAMLPRPGQVTKEEGAGLHGTDRLVENLVHTADSEATASSSTSRGESQRHEMTRMPLSASLHDDDEWVDVAASLMDPDSDWNPRSRSQRVYDRLNGLQGYRGAGMSEFDHTQTDSDSESSGSGRMRPIPRNLEDEEFEDVVSQLGLGPWREWFNLEQNPDHQRDRAQGAPEEMLYPQGEVTETECYVCFEEANLHRRLCCDFPVCDPCLESYLTVQVLQANVNIECLNINCNSYIHRSEISARLPSKMKLKFYKFLIDANIDPTVKTCPRCSSGLQVDKVTLKKRKVLKNGLPVTCQRCGRQVWPQP